MSFSAHSLAEATNRKRVDVYGLLARGPRALQGGARSIAFRLQLLNSILENVVHLGEPGFDEAVETAQSFVRNLGVAF